MDPLCAKKAKRKVAKKKQKKSKKLSSILESTWVCHRFPECFNILPSHLFHPRVANLLSFCSASLKQQSSLIKSFAACPFQPNAPAVNDINAFWSPVIARELGKAVANIRKARRLFKILLHHWRVKHLKKANEEDIVTLQPPKYPIFIVNWSTSSAFVFEASTIARDLMERLLCHDGFWQDSQAPRNPYTNQLLSLSQIISIYQQLSRAPVSLGWAVTAFRQMRYNLQRFLVEYSLPIQLYAYRKTMRDPTHIDYQERMLDFIEYAYDQESIDCLTTTYSYVLNHFTTNPILKIWTDLCIQFYEIPLLYSHNAQLIQQLQDTVIDKTVALLPRQDELKKLRLLHLRLNRT